MHSIRELQRVLALTPRGSHTFDGPGMNTEVFVRMFGGHLVGQALAAAAATVDPGKPVHSLHSYFVRPAAAEEPVRYEVDAVRDGRSYATRTVHAFQSDELCHILTASFHHTSDTGPEHAEVLPDVPAPETIAPQPTIPSGVPRAEDDFADWDVREVPQGEHAVDETAVSGRSLWFRYRHELPDSDALHAQALAYMSDLTLLSASLQAHPDHDVQLASLDHAIWFFRPVRVNQWMLYRQSSPAAGHGRALSQGKLFDASGKLLALIIQEGVARDLREGATPVPMRTQ